MKDIQDALDKQGGQSGDLFSAAAAAAAAAAATTGIPIPPNGVAGQPGVIPNNCSATIEAQQQYAQGYATAPCGPDGVPLPGAPGGMEGIDANNMDGLAAVSVDLDSATESNHDTALTLACAGGHEDLVTLLLGRGSDIGKFFGTSQICLSKKYHYPFSLLSCDSIFKHFSFL